MAVHKKLQRKDYRYLEECYNLAKESFTAGDAPFGSVLVDNDGQIIAQARNRVMEINILSHPELELALWAVDNLPEEERATTTMYTSGEHCPMCSAAQGWAGIKKLVYLHSGKQLADWTNEAGADEGPVFMIPVGKVIKELEIRGPGEGELLEKIKKLQLEYIKKRLNKGL